ncbi:DUF5047 domain-containing protein [Kitasatospora mediocidica]|uniref:DUF5047 domain-containing protein n=1 Tax=Kitasatospora mediocidica TaxID=58352 RepID=UPI0018DB2631|nr:DUF5047 domain-containing protein [Kitasatospora mediocidica]
MQSVSSRFLTAIRGPYNRIVTADLWYNQALVVSGLPIVDGSITVDRTQKIRRSGSITIGDPTFFPTFANSPLAPYGAELNIKWGIAFPDGSTETVSLGWFRIEDVTQETAPSQSNGGLPVLSLFDRAQAITDASFPDPIDRGGWDAMNLLTHLVQDVIPYVSVTYASSLTSGTVPGGTVFDSARMDAIESAAGYLNAEAYFDVNGNVQVVPVPALTQATPTSAAVWTADASTAAAVAAGASPSGVLVSAKRTVSRSGVYNYVACYGATTGSASPPTGYACDTDPRSPTYYGPSASGNPVGPFGASVYRYQNNLMTTSAMCAAAAATQLSNFLGLARSLSFEVCPNPALEAGDIIQVIYPDGKTELHLLDSFTIPLGPSSTFTGSTRTLTYQLSGGT